MASAEKNVQLVPATEEGTHDSWAFVCPGVPNDECGPWTSSGWPTKKAAAERGAQHLAEHEANRRGETALMQLLHEFREERGLVVDSNTGRVS